MSNDLFVSATRRFAVMLLVVAAVSGTGAGPGVAGEAESPTRPPTASAPPTTRAPLQPGDEIIQSWTVVPGGTGGRSFLSYQSNAGLVIKDSVSVQNYGNVPLNLRLYATDAAKTTDGSFALLSGEEKPTDVGSWVELAQEMITVPPGQQLLVPFTLTIPAGANPGDRAGGIVASSEVKGVAGDTNTIIVSRRTGVRLFMRVNGELRSNLVAESIRVSYRPSGNPFNGEVRARFRVANRGNVLQGGTYRVRVSAAFGRGKRDLGIREFPELLPGQSVEIEETVGGIPALFVARARVEIVAGVGGDSIEPVTTTRSGRAFAAPVWLAILLALSIAAFLVFRVVRMSRESLETEDHEIPGNQPDQEGVPQ